MILKAYSQSGKQHREQAFTLVEVVIAMALIGLLTGSIITAYVQTARRAEWSGYSLAAQALNMQQLEQARAARWDKRSLPPVDETLEIPNMTAAVLDLPVSGDNVIWATNYFTVNTLTLSTTPLVEVKAIRVDTVWPFRDQLFTNTTVTYRAPDQ